MLSGGIDSRPVFVLPRKPSPTEPVASYMCQWQWDQYWAWRRAGLGPNGEVPTLATDPRLPLDPKLGMPQESSIEAMLYAGEMSLQTQGMPLRGSGAGIRDDAFEQSAARSAPGDAVWTPIGWGIIQAAPAVFSGLTFEVPSAAALTTDDAGLDEAGLALAQPAAEISTPASHVAPVARPGVQLNRYWGNYWRDVNAAGIARPGLTITIEESFSTPWGRRILDVVARDADTGRIVGGIEAKAGGSPYKFLQLTKDQWLMERYGFPIFESRVPWTLPWFR